MKRTQKVKASHAEDCNKSESVLCSVATRQDLQLSRVSLNGESKSILFPNISQKFLLHPGVYMAADEVTKVVLEQGEGSGR